METKIGEAKGYAIVYDSRDRLFRLRDKDDVDVGSGKTQEEVEKKADALAKQNFKLPIPALEHSGLYLWRGKITSLNIDDKSAQFVYDDKKHGSHSKIHLHYDRVHELTPQNEEIFKQVMAGRNTIVGIEKGIEALMEKLEKPINLSYFGLKDTY
jgi:hypothetical protein